MTKPMSMTEALREVKDSEFRGVGCATIVMADDRRYNVVARNRNLVERMNGKGELIERLPASHVKGDVADIDWTCDSMGYRYFR